MDRVYRDGWMGGSGPVVRGGSGPVVRGGSGPVVRAAAEAALSLERRTSSLACRLSILLLWVALSAPSRPSASSCASVVALCPCGKALRNTYGSIGQRTAVMTAGSPDSATGGGITEGLRRHRSSRRAGAPATTAASCSLPSIEGRDPVSGDRSPSSSRPVERAAATWRRSRPPVRGPAARTPAATSRGRPGRGGRCPRS